MADTTTEGSRVLAGECSPPRSHEWCATQPKFCCWRSTVAGRRWVSENRVLDEVVADSVSSNVCPTAFTAKRKGEQTSGLDRREWMGSTIILSSAPRYSLRHRTSPMIYGPDRDVNEHRITWIHSEFMEKIVELGGCLWISI